MKIFKKIAVSMLFVILVSVSQSAADDSFAQEVEKEVAAVKLAREVMRGGYDLVTVNELKGWIDENKDMVIVDTMPYEASYKNEHVPGAIQILFPIADMEDWDSKETDGKTIDDFKKLLGQDKEKTIVIYCGFVKCTRSHNGAAWARKLGYKKVYRFAGGIYAWKGAGFPVESVK
ncbi:MAG: rhodanese-like domain-containing protein [Deltaproteobacteria bacterium]|nr:rhodanese-like domain-containing protein [Deltaproteobacteria bacterium]